MVAVGMELGDCVLKRHQSRPTPSTPFPSTTPLTPVQKAELLPGAGVVIYACPYCPALPPLYVWGSGWESRDW